MTLPSNIKTVAEAITFLTADNASKAAQIVALQGRATALEEKEPVPIEAPVITQRAAIGSDGSPQVGEELTGVDPVGNYPVSARRWLRGSTFLTDLNRYTPQVEGDYDYEGTITAPDGRTAVSRSTITVLPATVVPPGNQTLRANPAAEASAPKTAPDGTTTLNVGYNRMFVEADFPPDASFNVGIAAQDGDINANNINFISLSAQFGAFILKVDGVQRRIDFGPNGVNFAYPADNRPATGPFRLRMSISDDAVELYKSRSDGAAPLPFDGAPIARMSLDLTSYLVGEERPSIGSVLRPGLADNTRRTAFLTSNATNIRYGEYTAFVAPVRISNVTVGPDGFVEADITYTMAAAGLVDISATNSSGNVSLAASPAVVLENAVAGVARIRSLAPAAAVDRGSPLTVRIQQRSNPAAFATKVVEFVGVMSIGINPTPSVYYYLNFPSATKLQPNYRIARYTGPEVAGVLPNGDIPDNANTRGTRPAALLAPPPVNGQRRRFRWRGEMGEVRFTTYGDQAAVAQNVARSSDGDWSWVDFNQHYSTENLFKGQVGEQLIWMDFLLPAAGAAGVWPHDMQVVDLDANGAVIQQGYWDPRHIAEYSLFAGQTNNPFRFMDMQNAVGNSYTVVSRVSQAGDVNGVNATGVSVPDLLDLCTFAGVDGKFHLPLQCTEAYVRTEARRTAKWAKAKNRRVSWRVSNEIWNPGQGAWRKAEELSRTELGMTNETHGSNHDRVHKYYAYIFRKYMIWVTEEFAAEGVQSLLERAMELQNDNNALNAIAIDSYNAREYVDRIETAPYVGNDIAEKCYTDGKPDFAKARTLLRASMQSAHQKAKAHKDFATSRGLSYGTYEGLYEDFGRSRYTLGDNDPGFDAQPFWRAFNGSQDAYDITMEILNHWEVNLGVQYTCYADFRFDKHGYALMIGQPSISTDPLVPGSRIRQAIMDKIAQLKTAT